MPGPSLTVLETCETALIERRHDEECGCWAPALKSVLIFRGLVVGTAGQLVALKKPVLVIWAGLN